MTARDNARLVPQSGAERSARRSEGVPRNGTSGRTHPLGNARAFREGAWASGEFLAFAPVILAKPRRHAAFDPALIPAFAGADRLEPGAVVWSIVVGGP